MGVKPYANRDRKQDSEFSLCNKRESTATLFLHVLLKTLEKV